MSGNPENKGGAKNRTAFYDNLKFVLITLVLVGHFVGPLNDNCFETKVLWRTIYMFHMPAFLFVGGMFAKKLYTRENGLRINVLAFYIVMFLLLYTGLWAERHLWEPHPAYNLFVINSIPWYFVTMAALGATTPIIAKVRGGAQTVLPISIALAVVVPFNDNFDDFLVLGRTFAYAPFYYAGYFLSIKGYDEWITRQRAKKWPIVCAILCFLAMYAAFYLLPKPIAGTMSGLATGHNTYDDMKEFPSYIDALIRFADIGIAGILIVALSILTPSKRSFITDLGGRTLQVYFFHPFLYYLPSYLGWYDYLVPYVPISAWAMVAVGILLSIILAWPKWPARMFGVIRSHINIDSDEHTRV